MWKTEAEKSSSELEQWICFGLRIWTLPTESYLTRDNQFAVNGQSYW